MDTFPLFHLFVSFWARKYDILPFQYRRTLQVVLTMVEMPVTIIIFYKPDQTEEGARKGKRDGRQTGFFVCILSNRWIHLLICFTKQDKTGGTAFIFFLILDDTQRLSKNNKIQDRLGVCWRSMAASEIEDNLDFQPLVSFLHFYGECYA